MVVRNTTTILGAGVKSEELGDFLVSHTSDSIFFFARGEVNGKSWKLKEGSGGSGGEGMVEETQHEWSEHSGDLGIHDLFDHSRTTVTGSSSRNDTEISQTNARNHETRYVENDRGGMQVNEEGDGKIEKDGDSLGIMDLFQ